MKKINLLVSLVFSLFLLTILTASFVSGQITLINPAGSSTITGVTKFNVTMTLLDAGDTNFTCTLYAKSTLTANNSWSILVISANNTDGGANYTNSSFNSAGLEDANNYQFNVSCWNVTTLIGSTVNTGITVDNTKPTAPSDLSPTDLTRQTNSSSIYFSATIVDREVIECTLYFPQGGPGTNSFAMTPSGNSCTKTIDDVPDGTYLWYVQVTDETNTTDSSTNTVTADTYNSNAGKAVQQGVVVSKATPTGKALAIATGEEGGKIPTWLIVGGVIVILGIVIYYRNKR